MPFQPFMFAILFCVLNSCAQTRTLGHFAQYPKSWLTDYHFVTGVVVFFTGMAVNIHSDYILRNLRKPGETGYKIPKGEFDMFVRTSYHFAMFVPAYELWNLPKLLAAFSFKGGMFCFVSGANYFGESLEWVGFALACWTLAAAAFAFFTIVFLGSRAIRHHR